MFRRPFILVIAALMLGTGAFGESTSPLGTQDHDLKLLGVPPKTGDRSPGIGHRYTTGRARRTQIEVTVEENHKFKEYIAGTEEQKQVPLTLFLLASRAGATPPLDPVALTKEVNALRTIPLTNSAKLQTATKALLKKLGPGIRNSPLFQKSDGAFNEQLFLFYLTLSKPETDVMHDTFEKAAQDEVLAQLKLLRDVEAENARNRPDSAPPRRAEAIPPTTPKGADEGAPWKNPNANPGDGTPQISQLGGNGQGNGNNGVQNAGDKKNDDDKKENPPELAENEPPDDDKQPGPGGDKGGGGGGQPSPPPGGGGDAKYTQNPNAVQKTDTKFPVRLNPFAFPPAVTDRPLTDEEKKALGAQEAKPGNYGEEFVKYMDEGIASFTTERIKTMAMGTQKLISGLVTRIGLDQEVFTQPGTAIVQGIQNAANNFVAGLRRKQAIQPNLVNQNQVASALGRTPASVNPRDTFLRGPIRTPASNGLKRDTTL